MSISTKQGQVIVDGVAFDIWRIELAGGQIVLHGSRLGPVAARETGPSVVTVIGHDGRGIAQWDVAEQPGWPALNAQGILTITQPLRAAHAEGT